VTKAQQDTSYMKCKADCKSQVSTNHFRPHPTSAVAIVSLLVSYIGVWLGPILVSNITGSSTPVDNRVTEEKISSYQAITLSHGAELDYTHVKYIVVVISARASEQCELFCIPQIHFLSP
jgi:hypothetical protein